MTTPRLLGGRYELGETLGYGGMAEVHRGRDTRLGRDVAIKVLRQDLARDTGFQARFRREAQNAASLNHPAIVAVYDTGDETASDSTALPYIVMEYVEGRTLRDILDEEGRLLPERALEITSDVCAALEFSHRNGIVHRDIKPGNVMLTPSGQVKVMDFGIARAITSASATMTQTSAVIGTAQYLSPEQARGESVDARSDVYSTGCLLYELLVGNPPFTGDSPVAVAYQHVREDPVPPSELNPDISPSVDAVVLKAMAKNPANRYQSAAEMRADLVRAAAGRPVEATPVLSAADRTQVIGPPAAAASTAMAPRGERRRGRRIWVGVLIGLALIGVFIGAALVTKAVVDSGPREVQVPDVVGKSQDQATTLIKSRGLEASVKTVHESDQTKGKVVRQSPSDGTQLEVGKTVTITVDQGIARVKVPPVVGLSLDDAQAALTDAGLQWKVTRVASSEPRDQVVDVDPQQGQLIPPTTPVQLSVSNGTISVPNVLGMTDDQAVATLQNAGFDVTRSYQETDQADAGTVYAQDPNADSRAAPGSTVSIIVATAPPATEPTPSPEQSSPSESASPSPSDSTSASAGDNGGNDGGKKRDKRGARDR